MSSENLNKFIKKFKEITDSHSNLNILNDCDSGWLDGANDLMNALRMNIKDLEKLMISTLSPYFFINLPYRLFAVDSLSQIVS